MPGNDTDLRPDGLSSPRLSRMRYGVVECAIRPDHHGEKIIEAKWRGYIEAIIVLKPNADGVNNRGVSLQCFIRGRQSRVRNAETVFEPEMHTSLVPYLDRTDAIRCRTGHASDYEIFGFPGEIVVIEVDQVVVLNAGATRAAGEDVPNRLIEAPRNKPPFGQADFSKPYQQAHQIGIRANDRSEAVSLLLLRLAERDRLLAGFAMGVRDFQALIRSALNGRRVGSSWQV